jgi:hypothetical protein
MKTIISLLSIIILLQSCNKIDDFPAATQDGRNTFGMLVDGGKWIPLNSGVLVDTHSPFVNIFNNILEIRANYNVELIYFSANISNVGTYMINSKRYRYIPDSLKQTYSYCNDSTRYRKGVDCVSSYKLVDSRKSNIVISKLDTKAKIVSGTFYMTLINNHGDSLKIAEGRFDSVFTTDSIFTNN